MSAHHTAHEILQDPEFVEMARRKNAVSLALTIAMMVIYFGFIALLAWGKELLGRSLGGGITLGIPIGIGVIIAAWLLTGVYVRWANSGYDDMVARIKKKVTDDN
jgi:uncharacterized membrane protein (DUF485 family)